MARNRHSIQQIVGDGFADNDQQLIATGSASTAKINQGCWGDVRSAEKQAHILT
jgi:hypothetical protein